MNTSNLFQLKAFTVLICAVLAFGAGAYDFKSGGIYYNISGTKATVTYGSSNYNSYSGDVTIPKTVANGSTTYTVTAIGADAFSKCSSLTSVTLGSNVTSIGSYAFNGCPRLASVSLNYGLKSIASYAFTNCTALTTITMPTTLTSMGYSVFTGCTSLESILVKNGNANFRSNGGVLYNYSMTTLREYPNMHASDYIIPEGVTTIHTQALRECTNLRHITLPSTLKTIGDGAFGYCTNLEGVNIPAGVTEIPANAFDHCDKMQSIDADEGSETFASHDGVLFSRDFTRLVMYPAGRPDKQYNVPTTVTEIGPLAFKYTAALKAVYIPASVRTIGEQAFWYPGLERVVMDEGVDTIANEAFYYCESMKSVYIPSTVTSIGRGAFCGARSLSEVACGLESPMPLISDVFACGSRTGVPVLYVPRGAVDNYRGKTGWSDLNITEAPALEAGTAIASDSLRFAILDADCNAELTGVTSTRMADPGIPGKLMHKGHLCAVTRLGAGCLNNCAQLTNIDVPSSVTVIGGNAFAGCQSLESVSLPAALTMIEGGAFENTPHLTTITMMGTMPPAVATDGEPFMESHYINVALHVPAGSGANYAAHAVWGRFVNIIDETLPVVVVPGDLNGDGRVTPADISVIVDYLLGNTNGLSAAALDVDGDGVVTPADISALLELLMN